MNRSRSMAGEEFPWMLDLKIDAQGSWENLDEIAAQRSQSAVTEGEGALVAHLISLLVIFIGPSLTVGLLHDIWSEMEDLKI
jgi:hypothetical protein